MVKEILKLMITAMVRSVEAKKEALYRCKPGALVDAEPKFIWVKMMKRLHGYDKILALHNKFNAQLEQLLSERRHHYIIDMDSRINNSCMFTNINELNGEGRIEFWKEIDDAIRLFDARRLSLKLNPEPSKADNRYSSASQHHSKLPPIPPSRNNTHDTLRFDKKPSHDKYPEQETWYKQHSNKVWINKKFFK